MDTLPFGKYKDERILKVYEEDERYLRWFLGFLENEGIRSKFKIELYESIMRVIGDPNYVFIQPEKKKIVLIDTSTPDCPW